MNDFKDLQIWQKGMDLVIEIYEIIKLFPKYETYGIADQMRRAAVSIPSNIAEGYGRTSRKDYSHFLSIARGSKYELETQLLICIRLKYITSIQAQKALSLCEDLGKMLNSLIRKLNNN